MSSGIQKNESTEISKCQVEPNLPVKQSLDMITMDSIKILEKQVSLLILGIVLQLLQT